MPLFLDNRGAFDKGDNKVETSYQSLRIYYENEQYFDFYISNLNNAITTYEVYSVKKETLSGYFLIIDTNIDIPLYINDSLSNRVIKKFDPYIDLIVKLDNEESYNAFLNFSSSLDN